MHESTYDHSQINDSVTGEKSPGEKILIKLWICRTKKSISPDITKQPKVRSALEIQPLV